MNTILMFPTMRCNLKCEYCHFKVERDAVAYTWEGYGKEHRIENELPAQDYLLFLSQLQPYHLEFSGGEPTLYKGFKELVNNIPDGSRWAITSNTLTDIEGIDFSKCWHWTSSKHENINETKFDSNLEILNNANIAHSISFVVTKERFAEIIDKAIVYRNKGYQVNLLREFNPGVSWEPSKEWDLLLYLKRSMGFNVVVDDIPPEYVFKRGHICSAGVDYFAIMPDGNIYRCYSEAMKGEPIGNVKNYLPKEKELYKCFSDCLGCALDHKFIVRKLDEVENDA